MISAINGCYKSDLFHRVRGLKPAKSNFAFAAAADGEKGARRGLLDPAIDRPRGPFNAIGASP